ncbi:MAG: nucleotidyltransferase family protein [Acidiferrobacterales bacterium]
MQKTLNAKENTANNDPCHTIAGIVLAAGLSRRMEGVNKLLSKFRGRPLVAQVTDTLLASSVTDIIVVTGHQADLVRQTLTGGELRFVHNHRFEEGLSSSLCCGIEAVSPAAQGAMICLGDMPLVTGKLLDELICAFEAQNCAQICVPVTQGRRGNPVLWPRYFFPSILQSRGDAGARWLMELHPESVHEVPVDSEGILRDVDTLLDLEGMSA